MKTSLLALVVCTFVPLAAAQSGTVIGQPARPGEGRRIAAVSAEATERIPATRARMTAMIEAQAATPADAQAVVRQRSQALLGFLQRSGVENLQAGAMSLHPVYGEPQPVPMGGTRSGGSPEVVGYRAQWRANFETAAERAGEIVDGLANNGAARVGGFEFTATERELADARHRALSQAALKARADAEGVLHTLGHRPGEIVRVEIEHGGPIMPMQRGMEMMAFSGAAEAPTAVSPGLIDVRASVRLEVSY